MTTMIDKWFGIPYAPLRSGQWAKLTPSEQHLYIALMHDSERYSTRELQRTDEQICALVGVKPRSLCNARKKLQELGLIVCQRGRGNVYRYVLCNPETGRPWPGPPKVRVDLKKKDKPEAPAAADPTGPPTPPLPPSQIAAFRSPSEETRPVESH